MEITVEKINKDGRNPQGKQSLHTLKTVRVAVYARVSTDQEIQLHSLEEQMKGFKDRIARNPGWMLVDVYADEGITGTSVKRRKAFLRMMNDCEAGKIDYIMTRSISRFARNTVECLSYVRHLHSIGVHLYFEKEGIDTATAVSELILTVMAAFAQEESRSISENLKWGIRKRFEKGETRWTPTYGYRKTESGEIVIDPDEAVIVRFIFEMYRHGISIPDILEELSYMKVPTARGRKKWNKTMVKYLLQNEKYIGDARLQKWVSVDHISHRSVPNNATGVPSVYVRNHHVPIIDRHTYQQVQRILELKAPHGEYSRYPYYDTNFVCPLCGKKMIPRALKSNGHNRIIGCFDDDGCRGYALKVDLLKNALLNAFNALVLKERCSSGMKRMKEIKEETPRMESVQYYWLNDLVERVEFAGDTMKVFWKCGLYSEEELHAVSAAAPAHVAEIYRNYVIRKQIRNLSIVKKGNRKSTEKKVCRKNAVMQAAQNLRTGKKKGTVSR